MCDCDCDCGAASATYVPFHSVQHGECGKTGIEVIVWCEKVMICVRRGEACVCLSACLCVCGVKKKTSSSTVKTLFLVVCVRYASVKLGALRQIIPQCREEQKLLGRSSPENAVSRRCAGKIEDPHPLTSDSSLETPPSFTYFLSSPPMPNPNPNSISSPVLPDRQSSPACLLACSHRPLRYNRGFPSTFCFCRRLRIM